MTSNQHWKKKLYCKRSICHICVRKSVKNLTFSCVDVFDFVTSKHNFKIICFRDYFIKTSKINYIKFQCSTSRLIENQWWMNVWQRNGMFVVGVIGIKSYYQRYHKHTNTQTHTHNLATHAFDFEGHDPENWLKLVLPSITVWLVQKCYFDRY